jgi:hypothetical protein
MPPAVIGAKPLSVIPRGLPRGGFIQADGRRGRFETKGKEGGHADKDECHEIIPCESHSIEYAMHRPWGLHCLCSASGAE